MNINKKAISAFLSLIIVFSFCPTVLASNANPDPGDNLVLFEMRAYFYNDDKGDDITVDDIPAELKDEADKYHTELIEKVCELDDDLMMQYLEGEDYARYSSLIKRLGIRH